jgi:hypothetical protein
VDDRWIESEKKKWNTRVAKMEREKKRRLGDQARRKEVLVIGHAIW